MIGMIVIVSFVLGGIIGMLLMAVLTFNNNREPDECDDQIRKIYLEIVSTIEKELFQEDGDYYQGLMDANSIVIRTFHKHLGYSEIRDIEIIEKGG